METNKLIHTSKEEARIRAERAKEISKLLIAAYKLIIPLIIAFDKRKIGIKLLTAIKEVLKANNLPFEVQMDARYNTEERVPLWIYPDGSQKGQIIYLKTPSGNKRLDAEATIDEINKHFVNIPREVAKYIDAYENYDKYIAIADELKTAIDRYNQESNKLICYIHNL